MYPGTGIVCVDTRRGTVEPGGYLTGPAGLLPGTIPSGTYRYELVVSEQGFAGFVEIATRSAAFVVKAK